jgi:hypothetical protein
MPSSAVSPSILTREFDFSEFGSAIGLARPVMVGGASKGPLNTPIRVSNSAALIEKFGPPLTNDYGIQSAIQAFRKGDNLLYMRVADGNEDTADRTIPGTSGGTPAVAATGTIVFTLSTNPLDTETITIRDGATAVKATTNVTFVGNVNADDADTLILFDGTNTITFEFDNNASVVETPTLRQVVIGANAAATRDALIAKINSSLITLNITAADTTVGDPRLTLTADQPGTVGNTYTAVLSSGPLVVSASPFTGGANGTAYTFEFDNNSSIGGGNIGVLIGATAAITMANLIAAINNSALTITAVDTTVTVPQATLTNDVAGLIGNQTITETGAQITVTGMSGGLDAIPGSSTNVMTVFAKSPGTWGNNIIVQFRDTIVSGAPADRFDMLVFAPPPETPAETAVLQEVYTNLSLTSTNARYIEKVVEDGIPGESVPSLYVILDVLSAGTPSFANFTLGTGGGTVGADGVSTLASTDYIGTYAGQNSTGLQVLLNSDRYEFNLLAVPGITHTAVIDAMITLVETRGDALAVIDPPFGLTTEQVIDWHNGLGAAHSIPNSPSLAIDSNYAALYWSWQRTFDQTNKVLVFLPPSGFIMANMSENDRVAGPWFATAGYVRGVTDSLEAEYSPDLTERDDLVGEGTGNRVNPLAEFPALGVDAAVIFGNKTLQRTETALASVHIRRMLLHAKKLCASAVKVLVFDPNDPVSWKRFEQFCNPVLEEIASRRGLEVFKVTCNATTNPPSQRAKRIMRGTITLKPIEAAERIILDFALQAVGAEFTEAVLTP